MSRLCSRPINSNRVVFFSSSSTPFPPPFSSLFVLHRRRRRRRRALPHTLLVCCTSSFNRVQICFRFRDRCEPWERLDLVRSYIRDVGFDPPFFLKSMRRKRVVGDELRVLVEFVGFWGNCGCLFTNLKPFRVIRDEGIARRKGNGFDCLFIFYSSSSAP